MARKRNGRVPIGEVFSVPGGPVKAVRAVSLQARHHFTGVDQVDPLAGASGPNSDPGFIARPLARCALPRPNPGHRRRFEGRARGCVTRPGPVSTMSQSARDCSIETRKIVPARAACVLRKVTAAQPPRAGW